MIPSKTRPEQHESFFAQTQWNNRLFKISVGNSHTCQTVPVSKIRSKLSRLLSSDSNPETDFVLVCKEQVLNDSQIGSDVDLREGDIVQIYRVSDLISKQTLQNSDHMSSNDVKRQAQTPPPPTHSARPPRSPAPSRPLINERHDPITNDENEQKTKLIELIEQLEKEIEQLNLIKHAQNESKKKVRESTESSHSEALREITAHWETELDQIRDAWETDRIGHINEMNELYEKLKGARQRRQVDQEKQQFINQNKSRLIELGACFDQTEKLRTEGRMLNDQLSRTFSSFLAHQSRLEEGQSHTTQRPPRDGASTSKRQQGRVIDGLWSNIEAEQKQLNELFHEYTRLRENEDGLCGRTQSIALVAPPPSQSNPAPTDPDITSRFDHCVFQGTQWQTSEPIAELGNAVLGGRSCAFFDLSVQSQTATVGIPFFSHSSSSFPPLPQHHSAQSQFNLIATHLFASLLSNSLSLSVQDMASLSTSPDLPTSPLPFHYQLLCTAGWVGDDKVESSATKPNFVSTLAELIIFTDNAFSPLLGKTRNATCIFVELELSFAKCGTNLVSPLHTHRPCRLLFAHIDVRQSTPVSSFLNILSDVNSVLAQPSSPRSMPSTITQQEIVRMAVAERISQASEDSHTLSSFERNIKQLLEVIPRSPLSTFWHSLQAILGDPHSCFFLLANLGSDCSEDQKGVLLDTVRQLTHTFNEYRTTQA